eukprot:m.357949 g.357949  ORF g.357949 m.357949 type:complete len:261 (-) comp17993_c0_seq1:1068-1850(-)
MQAAIEDAKHGVWGPPTASADWCEINYAMTKYIAEFYNAMSSLIFVALGLIGLYHWRSAAHEVRFIICWLMLAGVGLGSTLFHSTLLRSMQLLDELPMMYGTLAILYLWIENGHKRQSYKYLPHFLVVWALIWTGIHGISHEVRLFHYHFGVLQAISMGYAIHALYKTKLPHVKLYAILYFAPFLLGFVLWNLDKKLCTKVQHLYFHAWWHILSGIAAYFCIALATATRYEKLGVLPKIEHNVLRLPHFSNAKDLHLHRL